MDTIPLPCPDLDPAPSAPADTRLDRTCFSVASLTDPSDDKEYWLTRSPYERLAAVELMRQIIYGYNPRATADMDIWIAIEPANAERMVTVLQEFGFDVPELSADLFLNEKQIVRLGRPPVKLEIMTSISGVEFDDCFRERVTDVIDGVQINLISLEHLKINFYTAYTAASNRLAIELYEKHGMRPLHTTLIGELAQAGAEPGDASAR